MCVRLKDQSLPPAYACVNSVFISMTENVFFSTNKFYAEYLNNGCDINQ